MKSHRTKFIKVNLTILLVITSLLLLFSFEPGPTGEAQFANVQCCLTTCQETTVAECPGEITVGFCNEIPQCDVGCCTDPEGYCYDNYARDSCEQKGDFFAGSCINNLQCTIQKPIGEVVGDTGIPIIYTLKDIISTDPSAASLGSPIVIKNRLLEVVNYTNLTTRVFSDNYSKEVHLFDDGHHGDGNPRDGLFAGIWQDDALNFSGFKSMFVTSGEMITSFQLSSSFCLPLLHQENKTGIIFVQKEAEVISSFQINAQGFMSYMMGLTKPTTIEEMFTNNKYNYYYIEPTISFDPYPKAQNECSIIDPIVIYLNPDVEVCQKTGNLIELNPNYYLLPNHTINQDEFVENICGQITTEAALLAELQAKGIPPEIEITYFENTGNSSSISLSFIITDNLDEEIGYKVYYDLDNPITTLAEGNASNGNVTDLILDLPDGDHNIVIQAIDSNINYAIAEPLQVSKSVNGFIIEITSLEKINYFESPNVTFTIYHNEDQNIPYIIDLENLTMPGVVETGNETSVQTDLEPGEHIIHIESTDNNGVKTNSLPYYIRVGTQEEEPILIPLYPPEEEE